MSYALLGPNAPDTVEFSYTPGASGVAQVQMKLKHGKQDISGIHPVSVHLSDSENGNGVTATTPSGTVSATTGAVAQAVVAKKELLCAPTVAGDLTLAITDTAKTGFYVCVTLPGGIQVVSRQLATEDYGA